MSRPDAAGPARASRPTPDDLPGRDPTARVPRQGGPAGRPGTERSRDQTQRVAPPANGQSRRPDTHRDPDAPEHDGHPADYRTPPATVAINATKAIGRGIGKTTVGAGRLTAKTTRFATTKFRAYTHSGGAGESGLARVSELHASNAAGDAAMMLALAGTLFFNPQTATARSSVALFLLLTMVPFTLVAPLIGPILDKFSHGRRWAIGTTMAVRAFLCWVLAEAVNGKSGWLFPAALGVLIASKAYTIARAAAIPRVLPPGTTLVNANSKSSMSGVIGAVLGGAAAGLAMLAGPDWALRVAFAIFVLGTIQAIRLPASVDSSAGELKPEDTAPIVTGDYGARPGKGGGRHPAGSAARGTARPDDENAHLEVDSAGLIGKFKRRTLAIPWPVRHAMWSTGGTRLLTGFLIMFMAFLTKEHPIDGMKGTLVLTIVVAGIGVGNALGSVLGNLLKDLRPERVAMISVLVATAMCIATAIWYGVWTLAGIGLVQGLSSQVSKLCLDALVQREVPEAVRTSVFAWSETMLQGLWVLGGALGIVLPLNPYIGFPVAAVGLLWTIYMAARTRRVGQPARRSGPGSGRPNGAGQNRERPNGSRPGGPRPRQAT